MTVFQKVVKYLAIAFAIFLTVSIIGGVFTCISGISFIFSGIDSAIDTDKEAVGEMQEYPIDGDISSLSVDISAAELIIETSDKFSVETNHNYISVSTDDGELCINETKKLFSYFPKGITVILYIPEDFVFESAAVETGAGKVKIGSLSAEGLKLSLGAGEVKINNLEANSYADIDGGVGALKIDGGRLCNLDLDMGVGALKLKSRIEGESKLDYGVGETELTLLGSIDDYQIELDKGIGEAKLDGESMRDDSVYGSGKNLIDIDGDIGEINIDFSE